MPSRCTTGIPDKTEFTILDVILRIEHLKQAIDRHTTVDESLETTYRKVDNSLGSILNRLEIMNETFISLVKGLQTIINIREREADHAQNNKTKSEE